MNVIFFTKHELLGASSRYRSIQYFPYIEDENIKVIHLPLFNDKYLRYKYENGTEPKFISFFRIFIRVIFSLFYCFNRRPVLVIEKELIPYFPPIFEWLYSITGRKFILDYDDAVWHNYDNSSKKIFTWFLKGKHKKIISWSSGVICGSSYIADYVRLAGSSRFIFIPTVINSQKYKLKTVLKSNSPLVIGWIGSPSSSQYIKIIEKPLKDLSAQYNVKFRFIGIDKKLAANLCFSCDVIPWSSKTELIELNKIDIGIMPLADSSFERGKCSFKIIQYMGMSKPVVCSPVGENKIVVGHGENGFHANTLKEWFYYLELLILNESLRVKLGQAGRKLVENKYSLHSQSKIYRDFILNIK